MQSARVRFLVCVIVFSGCNWSGSKDSEHTGSGGDNGSGGAASTGTGGSVTTGSGGITGTGGSDVDAAMGGTGGLAADDGGAPEVPACGMQTFKLESTPPDLLVVLDRSGSMLEQPNGQQCPGTTPTPACVQSQKWTQVTSAINQVVSQTESTIRWGLKVFPDTGACGAAAEPKVAIGDKSAAAINMAMTEAVPPPSGAATPTAVAVSSAAAYLTALPDRNPKYILLATDGLPNCAGVVPDQSKADELSSVAAVMDSAGKGIPVFVVGIATNTGANKTLTDMANAGGRPQMAAGMPAYYLVTNSDQLVATLKTIQRKIASCEFKLEKVPAMAENVVVKAGSTVIPKDASGWDYGDASMTSIVLKGSYCDQVMAGTITNIEAVFPCVPISVP
jgi:von Willebrand factor type A domain